MTAWPDPGARLDDVEWGDVISDDAGVLVVRGEVDGDPVVVKRYAAADQRREIANYRLLYRLGVPTLPVLGAGDDWLILAEATDAGYRLGTQQDLTDPRVARLLAAWYHRLHVAGETLPASSLTTLFSETDLVTPERLVRVGERWPEVADQAALARSRLPLWRSALADVPRTLTHGDFWFTNLAVYWNGASALMFDHNLMGSGPRAGDLRNVTTALTEEAGQAFVDEYARLAAERGSPIDPSEVEADIPIAHLAALVAACDEEVTPHWAEPSLAWLAALT